MFLYDRLELGSERQYSDEGFLVVPARIGRVGVQVYTAAEMGLTDRDPDEKIRVFRSEKEVFDEKSMLSFSNKPVTDNHPPELVTSKNVKKFSVGHSDPEVTRDGMFLKANLHINDADAIAKVESGKSEISNGYVADIDWTPGISPIGENFDCSQVGIKGNHIAIVERGRAGPACRLADNLPTKIDEVIMAKTTIDGVDYEVTEQAAQAVNKLQARLTDAEHETEEEKKKAKDKENEDEKDTNNFKKKEDALQAKLDDALSKVPSDEALTKLVIARSTLVDSVLKICPDIKCDDKSSQVLKREVVAIKRPNVQLDSKSDDYIDATFDLLSEEIASNSQHSLDSAFSDSVNNGGKGGTEVVDTRPASIIARDKMMDTNRNMWKGDKAS